MVYVLYLLIIILFFIYKIRKLGILFLKLVLICIRLKFKVNWINIFCMCFVFRYRRFMLYDKDDFV